jgi:tripartite-type tricarboxylate transporter receptor subunit TctC
MSLADHPVHSRRRIMFRTKHLIAAAAALAVFSSPAMAAWPDDKPIEVVVGFAPGGGTDLMARKLFPFVQKRLGGKAQFVVVNKPGASGEISNAYVAKSKPDGYTLGIVNVPAFLYLPMARKTQYQVEDLQLVARIVDDPTVLITRSETRVDSLPTALTIAKQTPGAVSVGHNGEGSNGDLVLQLLRAATGVELAGIPYKGTGPQKVDVLGGHLPLGTVSAAEVPELHKGGKAPLRAVVQFTEKRSAALPDVPTAMEAGIKVLMSSERGLAAPKGVPADIVKRLETAIAESLRDPEFLASAAGDAPVIAFMPGAQWSTSLEQNQAALRQIVNTRK